MRARSEGRAGKQAGGWGGGGGYPGGGGWGGGGEVPSDSPAVVRTELTLLSFPLTAASTVRKLNPVAAWSTRRTVSALLRAVRARVRCAEPFGMGHCGLLGLSLSPLALPPGHSSTLNYSFPRSG